MQSSVHLNYYVTHGQCVALPLPCICQAGARMAESAMTNASQLKCQEVLPSHVAKGACHCVSTWCAAACTIESCSNHLMSDTVETED